MTSLRVWIMILFGWLFVLYNIERLLGPANLMPAIYLVAPLAALPLMVSPRRHFSIPWLLVLPIPVVVSLRLGLEYPISGASLPLTTTEIGCVGLTGVLANQVRQHFEYLRHSAAEAITEAQTAAEAKIAEVWKEAQNTLAAKLDEARAEEVHAAQAAAEAKIAEVRREAQNTLAAKLDEEVHAAHATAEAKIAEVRKEAQDTLAAKLDEARAEEVHAAQAAAEAKIAEVRREAQNTLAAKLAEARAEQVHAAQAAAEAKIAQVRTEAQDTLAAKLAEARAETARVLAAVVARLKNADQTLTTQFDQPQAEAIELDRVRTEDADEIELDDLRTDIDRFFQRDAEAWRGDAASHKPAARGDSVRGCLTPAVGDSAETNQG